VADQAGQAGQAGRARQTGHRLWVVVPAFDEERSLPGTLRALAGQRDREFTLVVVDNGSRDGTADVVREFAAGHPDFDVRLIGEPQKGTGAAADTGMRFAIGEGAELLARTDADCVPGAGWTAAVRAALTDGGLQLVTGRLRPRRDEFRLRAWERWLLPAVVSTAATFGRFRPGNRDPEYRGRYLMCPGCNLGITAELYERCGGFPRTAIEDEHEDRALVNRVRRVEARYGLSRAMVVHGSVRRLRAYGLVGTLRWYADHGIRPAEVDIR
jgi:glycosyltransferase involved in cell wall biosynthesis